MSFRYISYKYVYHTIIYVINACTLHLALDTVSIFTHTHMHAIGYCMPTIQFCFHTNLFVVQCFVSFHLIHTMSINVCALHRILWQSCKWLCVCANVRLHTRQTVWKSRCGRYQNTIKHVRDRMSTSTQSSPVIALYVKFTHRLKEIERESKRAAFNQKAAFNPIKYMVYHNMYMRACVPFWSLSQRRQQSFYPCVRVIRTKKAYANE